MRQPVAIGFYPGEKDRLENVVKSFLKTEKLVDNPIGCIVPHAGYDFSGAVAGGAFGSKTDKRNFVIFGTNHSGSGKPIAASAETWLTPLGEVKTNKDFIKRTKIDVDESAHVHEHSIEAQLPFLQVMYKDFTIVPISVQQLDIDSMKEVVKNLIDPNSFYIASGDFIHFGPNYGYVPASGSVADQVKWVTDRDNEMIDMICKLDAEGFYDTVLGHEYTVCGVAPFTMLMLVLKHLGAKRGVLIDYRTSHEVHPSSSFVGYAGIVFE